jgi:hypothetical protein
MVPVCVLEQRAREHAYMNRILQRVMFSQQSEHAQQGHGNAPAVWDGYVGFDIRHENPLGKGAAKFR